MRASPIRHKGVFVARADRFFREAYEDRISPAAAICQAYDAYRADYTITRAPRGIRNPTNSVSRTAQRKIEGAGGISRKVSLNAISD